MYTQKKYNFYINVIAVKNSSLQAYYEYNFLSLDQILTIGKHITERHIHRLHLRVDKKKLKFNEI